MLLSIDERRQLLRKVKLFEGIDEECLTILADELREVAFETGAYIAREGEMVEVENQNEIVDDGASGVSYAFKPMQKVSANHPAVKDCPGAFMPLADLNEADLDLVTT